MSGFSFGTKAETLAALAPRLRLAKVPTLAFFSVAQWRGDPAAVLAQLRASFSDLRLAVRSSARAEDSEGASHAGAFTSLLAVAPDDEARAAAIDEVAASLTTEVDQVLVMEMVEAVAVAGVMTTRALDDGAPYLEINYDDWSGRTDTVTGGIGANKTVIIHHDASERLITSARVVRWRQLATELRALTGHEALDVEFAERVDGTLWLLQVRRIATERAWRPGVDAQVRATLAGLQQWLAAQQAPPPGVLGRRTVYGEMPDWNPAEIIGSNPRPLAVSLYQRLITDAVWREARASMGYRRLPAVPLLAMLAGRPFIDVRASFNSFLPDGLDDATGTQLVEAWLERLVERPELHDKVEFEVATTSLDFDFDATLDARYPGVLSVAQRRAWQQALTSLTRAAVTGSSLREALAAATELERRQREGTTLDEAVTFGTRPFAVAARHAFIAESLLRSAVTRGAWSAERLLAFRRSVRTVATELSEALEAVVAGRLDAAAFFTRFGHLRPGTYDVLSRRYDQRGDLFDGVTVRDRPPLEPFTLTPFEARALSALGASAGLGVDAAQLLTYATTAIQAREWVKFVFTRSLSDVLEQLVARAAVSGVDRETVSRLPVSVLLEPTVDAARWRALATEGAAAHEAQRAVRLNYLVRDERDLFVVPLHRSAPNFVTARQLEARTVYLDARAVDVPLLEGCIVCVENADPGFDWIFTRGIAGLITRFGGANSHMAIRCAEFGLPAAIGCGELTFARCVQAGRVDLNCAERRVRPLFEE